MGIRRNYRNLTDVERDRFIQALYHVKSTGVVDQFADLHARHFFHGIHRSSHFLPWHREMLLRFERELQTFHPDVTIPYWDSTVDRSPSDPLWANNFLGQFNAAWGLNRSLGVGGTLPTQQQVDANQRRDNYDTFWRELENPIHNRPHTWVGGVMARIDSPGDPVFYLHHGWIDLLWAKWQREHSDAPFVASGPGVGLNDPMMEWPDRTPANVLDHHALGYIYDTEPESEKQVLAELNERSFQAENKASRAELEPILADDFTIIRSTGVIEDKQQMLERVASDTSGRIREIEEANVSVYGDSAVVTSRIALREPGGEISGRFWNTKVFVKREGGWRCVTWQVTRIQ